MFVGVALADATLAPLDTVIKVLPATQYAVFTIRGQAIVGDWPLAIFTCGRYAHYSGYELAHTFHIQYHDGDFKGSSTAWMTLAWMVTYRSNPNPEQF